jgi:nitrate/nitrite-specific signal transduction histidine kinase
MSAAAAGAREALRNAPRPSHASVIEVEVFDRDGDLRVSVEDDGIGFDPDSINTHVHFGLALMRGRC